MHTPLEITYHYDFALFGIRSLAKEYKLAWLLNQRCVCHFKKAPDISLPKDDTTVVCFSQYKSQHGSQVWRLLENKTHDDASPDTFLIPELAEWNFLLWLHDPGEHVSLIRLAQNLKTISDIESFSQISVDLLPNKENLLF